MFCIKAEALGNRAGGSFYLDTSVNALDGVAGLFVNVFKHPVATGVIPQTRVIYHQGVQCGFQSGVVFIKSCALVGVVCCAGT